MSDLVFSKMWTLFSDILHVLFNFFFQIYAAGTPVTVFVGLLLGLFWYESVRILAWLRNPTINVFFFPSWTLFTKTYGFLATYSPITILLVSWFDFKFCNNGWTPHSEIIRHRVFFIKQLTSLFAAMGQSPLNESKAWYWAQTLTLTLAGFNSGWYQTYRTIRYCILFVVSFFKLAFFSAYVSYILFIFYYKVFLDQDLYPRKAPRFNVRLTIINIYTYSASYYSTYFTTTPGPSLVKHAFVDRFLSDVVFLKRYYRLNDLIWQDGMLIDFLQKKVADRWVRTFVIYSGYLFNERFVFDFVVRFYIDYIIWPTYRTSIYEFNNVSSTLSFTLFLMILFFFIFGLYYLSFFLL